MSKRFSFINFFSAIIFLLTTIFPPGAFSYQSARDSEERYLVDESKGMDIVSFKKIRCPSCLMEFFYIPGKDSPHSRWVQYEVKKELNVYKKDGIDIKDSLKDDQDKVKELKKQDKLFSLFKLGGDAKDKNIKKEDAVKTALATQESMDQVEYKLRQQLTCPYDGFVFFPEGDLLDQAKSKSGLALLEEPSNIESSFSKAISFGAQKDLKQFGYELFLSAGRPKKGGEGNGEGSQAVKSMESLAALGMLKTALGGQGGQDAGFSSSQVTGAEDSVVVPVNADYVVGPGDTLLINIWGSVQESFPVEVDREGKIMLPKSGPLYIWGMKLKEAEARITQRLNQYYTNFNVDVSMGKLRSIRVFVMGEVKKPGAYTVSSQSSVFQALYEAGGPTKMGSMRKIKIASPNGKSREIDLYQFLLKGEQADNSIVQSGDTIFVPSIGDVVGVSGNVKRPAIYETKSDISLSDLMEFAGGITPTGNLQHIQVERIEDNERRVVVDIKLKNGNFKDINLHNGDMVMVSPIVRLKHEFVTILGNVENPGDYGLKEDMSVEKLIEMAKGFMPGSFLYRAEIARVSEDRSREIIPINLNKMMLGGKDENISLKEWDILLIYSEAEVSAPSFVEIDGAVNKPGKYELTPNMKISDLIFRAGGVTSGDFIRGAELFHIVPGEQPVVREIGVKRIFGANIAIDKDIILQAGDTLFVKREPKLTEKKMVTIKGQVRFPGTYPVIQGERLSDLIARAGGYTQDAFLPGAVFTRKSIKEVQEKMRKKFLEKEQRTIMEEQQAMLLRAGSAAGADSITQSVRARIDMMEMISEADIEGRMVIALVPLDQLKHSKYDIPLEDGDSITIPESPSAVTVIGSVNNPTSVPFEVGKGIDYYVQRTGGMTKHADKSGVYVVRANGEAINKFMMTKFVERGDTIVIPQEFKYWTPPGQLLKDTVEILSRIVMGVGIIAALN
ncbi:MAG: SLBB domain-containing protein [Candidatus Omnitrophota bacterium]|nr:SLBB domain-containing protein [Candidatus Omnitrophota bacterium]